MLKIKEEYNLYQIVSKQNLLDQEIRSVRAGIHALIYDNYSKLITVSEVLSKIKFNYGKIEEDKNLLDCKMGLIENLSSNISKNLPSSENKQLKLMKSKESMGKLNFIINLVPRLKKYVETANFVAAGMHYLKAKNFLDKYQQSESLKGIIEESRDIIWYIQGKLRTKLDCCIYSCEEIALTLNLILDLGEEKEQALQDFLQIVKDNLSNILLRIEGNCLEDSGDCKTSTDFKITFCSDSSCNFLNVLSKSITVIQRVFTGKNATVCSNSILTNFLTTNIDELFSVVRQVFKTQFDNITDELLAYALDRLYRECYECSICIPDSALSQKVLKSFLISAVIGVDIILGK
ncbi:vacuolar protein sorting-associated protein 51 homolog [Caerostris darwini]|uniref:Vacuolar protein sorting-associated protein 51 homolog n=1 Tax=Caerostris darwini TaxID=1538125 RepID=A0AAV4U3J3_9ARAC|nr:vacuolar protein sorting-associated protein 51 homolog [Caerostris darwini]